MPRRVKKIDFKSWSLLPGLALEASADAIVGATGLSFSEPATILRIRSSGGLFMFDASAQAGDKMTLALGIAIMGTDAFASGVGAMPDPVVEFEFPWLWLWQGDLRATVTAGDQADGSTTLRIPTIDSRSMRKVTPRETLVLVAEFANAAGAPVTILEMPPIRVLIGS